MKYILFAITLFCISAASFGQATFDSAKIVRYTSYGSSYPRWVVRDVFIPPTLSDTPTIAAVNRKYWKGAFMLRMAVGDTSHYFHNGLKWARFTGVGGGSGGVTTFNSRAGAITPLFSDYSAFYSALGHPHSTVDITSGQFGTGRLGSGTANSTTWLRGDGTWTTITFPVASWGTITGTLSSQTDLNTALNSRPDSNWIKIRISDSLKGLAILTDSTLKGNGVDTPAGVNPALVTLRSKTLSDSTVAANRAALKLNSADYINAITLTGTVNGINTVFTLPSIPQTGTLSVKLNGQEIYITDDFTHTAGTTTVTFISPPPTGSKVRGTYFKL